MSQILNVYCDESCYLEHDNIPVMVLGAIWCPLDSAPVFASRLRQIKKQHHLDPSFEIKWVKVSPAKLSFYKDVVRFFFEEKDLRFRAVVVPNKSNLNHSLFNQDHDDWYYKMYFVMLKQVLDPKQRYRIYIDIKDTKSKNKVDRLHKILCGSHYDFKKEIIERVQQVRSHEVELLQLADLLIGALAYIHRGLATSPAKLELVKEIQRLSGITLQQTTLPREDKVNLLIWNAREW